MLTLQPVFLDASCLLATGHGFVHPESGGSRGSDFSVSPLPLSQSTFALKVSQEYEFEEIIRDKLHKAMTRKDRHPRQLGKPHPLVIIFVGQERLMLF